MKKTFLTVLMLFIPFLSYSQTSSGVWNSTTATYTNSVHKITWKLIEDLSWIERPFLTDGILFKMRNDDTHVLVKIGATKTEPIDQDIWDEVSMFESDEFTKPEKQLAAYNGMEYIGTKAVKSQIEDDVMGATHSDITLLMALRDLYYDRLEPVIVECPNCRDDRGERRDVAVSVDSLIVDFFHDLYVNSPIDASQIVFK